MTSVPVPTVFENIFGCAVPGTSVRGPLAFFSDRRVGDEGTKIGSIKCQKIPLFESAKFDNVSELLFQTAAPVVLKSNREAIPRAVSKAMSRHVDG